MLNKRSFVFACSPATSPARSLPRQDSASMDRSYSLRTSKPRRGLAIGYLVATLVVAAVVGLGLWMTIGRRQAADGKEPLVARVVSGPFEHSVVEQGEVESAQNVEIKSRVKSRNTSGMQLLWV